MQIWAMEVQRARPIDSCLQAQARVQRIPHVRSVAATELPLLDASVTESKLPELTLHKTGRQ